MKKVTESGQATVELVIASLALMSLFVVLIYVAGLCLTNFEVLVSARTNAEHAADAGLGGQGESIEDWSYRTVTVYGNDPERADDDRHYRIPFTPWDRPTLSVSQTQEFKDQLLPLNDDRLDGLRHNYYDSLPDDDLFLIAADLAMGIGSHSGDPVRTLDEQRTRVDVKRKDLDEFMAKYFNFYPQDPIDSRANRVYLPVINQQQPRDQ